MAFELDPARSALIIQDLQNDVIAEGGAFADSGAPAHAQSQNVVENVKSLAAAARKAGMAVIHVHYIVEEGAPGLKLNAPLFQSVAEAKALVRGTWGAAAVAGLEPQAGDLVVEKMRMNAFHDTHLETILKGLGVDTIVISGAWTNFSVEHTARHGADAGYRAIVPHGRNLDHQRRVAQRRPQLRAGEHRRARDLRRGRSGAWRLNASGRQSTRGARRSLRPLRKLTTTRMFSSVLSKSVEWFEPRITCLMAFGMFSASQVCPAPVSPTSHGVMMSSSPPITSVGALISAA